MQTNIGGILPRGSGLRLCSSILWATSIGFFTPVVEQSTVNIIYIIRIAGMESPDRAPTLPKSPVRPSMMAASHSTSPSAVRFDPYPVTHARVDSIPSWLLCLTSIQAFLILEDSYCFLHSIHGRYCPFANNFQSFSTSTGSIIG